MYYWKQTKYNIVIEYLQCTHKLAFVVLNTASAVSRGLA